jgi:DGQHR domain-containing protein
MEKLNVVEARAIKVFPGIIIFKCINDNYSDNILVENRGISIDVNKIYTLGEPYENARKTYYRILAERESKTEDIFEQSQRFRDIEDFQLFIDYYFNELSALNARLSKELDDDFNELVSEVKGLFEFFQKCASYENLTESAFISFYKSLFELNDLLDDEVYSSLIERLEFVDNEVADKIIYDSLFSWESWRRKATRVFTSGFNDIDFIQSELLPGSVFQVHYYSSPPKLVNIPAIRIVQKGCVFYIAKMEVRLVAQSSMVPTLKKEISVIDSANRILLDDTVNSEWQRQADLKRIERIANFINRESNIMANAPMLYANNAEAFKFGDTSIQIDFAKFLIKLEHPVLGDVFSDFSRVKNGDDLKPFWLIDGQHRILGIHRVKSQHRLEIPVIIFPPEFGQSSTAKLFAEINTFQQKLSSLHEIFMQHRFKLDHIKKNRRFRDIWNIEYSIAIKEHWHRSWEDSRANHFAYESAALLSKSGPLESQIQFLVENKVAERVINAEQFINYSRKFFLSGPYSLLDENAYISSKAVGRRELLKIYSQEIMNYFEAIRSLYGGDKWPDGLSRWEDKKGNRKSLLKKETFFQMILEIYPLVHNLAFNYQRSLEGAVQNFTLETKHFYRVLRPLRNVDWLDVELNNFFKGGGEKPRRNFEVWVADCLINCQGEEPSLEDILSTEFCSIPGKGILAQLAPPNLQFVRENVFNDNGDIELIVSRPKNARWEGEFKLLSKNVEFHSGIIRHQKYLMNDDVVLLIPKKLFQNERQVNLRIEYFNMHSRNSGVKGVSIPT